MSHVYVTSDWHFGHSGITEVFRKQFFDLATMEYEILDAAMRRLTKRDVLICVGDMSFTVGGLEKIATLPCRKILVRGNHDTCSMEQYNAVFEEIHGAYDYKGTFITHIPIHPMELYRRYNIHGHCHRGGPGDLQLGEDWHRYYNAIVEFNNYEIIRFDLIIEKLKRQKEVANDH